jgi:hypothetical protein
MFLKDGPDKTILEEIQTDLQSVLLIDITKTKSSVSTLEFLNTEKVVCFFSLISISPSHPGLLIQYTFLSFKIFDQHLISILASYISD